MSQQTVNIGSSENKGDGDPLRDAFIKINNNFTELYDNFNSLEYDKNTKTFTGTFDGDLIGSVFAEDSSPIIDATDGSLYYAPTTPSDWNGTAPTTVGAALDRLATLVKTLNGGTGA